MRLRLIKEKRVDMRWPAEKEMILRSQRKEQWEGLGVGEMDIEKIKLTSWIKKGNEECGMEYEKGSE